MKQDFPVKARNSALNPVTSRERVTRLPVEWYGSGCWRLPSGKALAEYALEAGFLAPVLFKADASRNKPLSKAERT